MATKTNSIKNDLAAAYAAQCTHAELTTTLPTSTAGTAAPTTPRVPITWSAAGAVGPLGSTAQPATPGKIWGQAIFTIQADADVVGVNYFNALTAGTYKDGQEIPTPRSLKSGDTYTVGTAYTQG